MRSSRYLLGFSVIAASAGSSLGQTCSEVAKLTPAWAGAGDVVGREIASDGATLLIGAVGHGGASPESGRVAVFQRQGGAWEHVQAISPPVEIEGAHFGDGIAVCGDWALIGAPAIGTGLAGAVHAYQRISGVWAFAQTITAPTPTSDDRFGVRIAIDRGRAVVSAGGEDGAAGAVYVLKRTAGVWAIEQRLSAGDGAAGDLLGLFGVAIEGDTLLATAAHHDAVAIDSGAVYVFERGEPGQWEIHQKVIPDDASGGSTFGSSLSLHAGRIAVGANGADAAYVFQRSTCDGLWQQTARLDPGFLGGGKYGDYLALDGDVLVVGVPTFDGMSGRADFHQRNPLTGAWRRASTLMASDGSPGDQFGYGICVLGGRVLLGAHRDDGQGTDCGTVYEFDLSGCVCSADFDGSGFVDLEDFVAFVLRFEAGC